MPVSQVVDHTTSWSSVRSAQAFATCARASRADGPLSRLGAAIDPGVIGPLLDQYIAGLEMDLRIIEQHVDLAGHHDGIVHGAGTVHGGMARRPSPLGRPRTKARVHAGGIEVAHLRGLGRKVHDAKRASAGGRHYADIDSRAIGSAAE